MLRFRLTSAGRSASASEIRRPLGLTPFPFILGAWAAFWLLAAELWLCAEFWIAAVSSAVVLCQLAERQGRPRDVTIRRLGRLSLPSLLPPDQGRRLCLVSTLWV